MNTKICCSHNAPFPPETAWEHTILAHIPRSSWQSATKTNPRAEISTLVWHCWIWFEVRDSVLPSQCWGFYKYFSSERKTYNLMYTDILQGPYHQELGLQVAASDSGIHVCNVSILKCIKNRVYLCHGNIVIR